jgi:hypothetical protein
MKLRAVIRGSERLLYCDHVESEGETLFQYVCQSDVEGVVAKRKFDPYLQDHARWLKIRNPEYSQCAGREKLFEQERQSDPDLNVWNSCTLACAEIG